MKHLTLTLEDLEHFSVFEILGLGGIGKTRLLSELRDAAGATDKKLTSYWVNLSSESTGGPLAPLRALRSQVSHDCMLFDAATLVYWTDTGQQFPLSTAAPRSSNAVLKAAEAGGGVAGIPLPLTFAVEVFNAIKTRFSKLRHYDKAEFEAIDELRHQPEQILQRLPHYLASDLLRRGGSRPEPLVVFYDSYAAQSPSTLERRSPWLREFIGSMDVGLHIVSTRESLGWNENDWGDVIHHIALGSLPDDECRILIRQRVGEVPAAVEQILLEGTNGIPFFLEIGLDAIELHGDADSITVDDLPASPRDAVTHLLGHLTVAERNAAIALGAVQLFDRELFVHLISTLNLEATALDFSDITTWFFVDADAAGLYRMNPILSDYIRFEPGYLEANAASLHAACGHLKFRTRRAHLDPSSDVALYQAVLSGWASVDDVPTAAIEDLVSVGYALYDAGFWIELGATEPQAGRILAEDHPCRVVSDFFSALATRRSDGPAAALGRLEQLEPFGHLLGRRRRTFDIEVAYISELTGDYSMARDRFHELDLVSQPFDPRNRDHFRARLYHADMLTMDGSFKTASHLLVEAYEALDADRAIDWAELVRHRGHVLRLSLIHEDAELLYLRALNATSNHAMIEKLQTNLAETYCWTDPATALVTVAGVIDMHTERGTVLEIVKCYAAAAIAHSSMENFVEARSNYKEAAARARQVGYPAGEAFAAQAGAVVEARSGNTVGAVEQHQQLQALTKALGTYGHLAAISAAAASDDLELMRLGVETDWIDDEDIEGRIGTAVALA